SLYSTLTCLVHFHSTCNLVSALGLRPVYNGFKDFRGVIMSYETDDPIKLTRDCQLVAVPAVHTLMLPQGTEVMITQSLGGSYTLLVPSYGGLFRLSNHDSDAIGKETRSTEGAVAGQALTG